MAFGLPLNEAIQRMLQSARDLDQSADKMGKEYEQHRKNSFGQSIAAAVTHKLSRPRAAVFASAAIAPKAETESFGQAVAQAVKVRLAQRFRSSISAETSAPDESSFAEKLKEAAQEKSGQKRHREQAERERERYEEQRKRALGE